MGSFLEVEFGWPSASEARSLGLRWQRTLGWEVVTSWLAASKATSSFLARPPFSLWRPFFDDVALQCYPPRPIGSPAKPGSKTLPDHHHSSRGDEEESEYLRKIGRSLEARSPCRKFRPRNCPNCCLSKKCTKSLNSFSAEICKLLHGLNQKFNLSFLGIHKAVKVLLFLQ